MTLSKATYGVYKKRPLRRLPPIQTVIASPRLPFHRCRPQWPVPLRAFYLRRMVSGRAPRPSWSPRSVPWPPFRRRRSPHHAIQSPLIRTIHTTLPRPITAWQESLPSTLTAMACSRPPNTKNRNAFRPLQSNLTLILYIIGRTSIK